ncbi:MAG: sce7725 family protein [Bacteroidales bacterium]|jgi:hypothetical protein
MYFPYLRGKQFELIALREICDFIDNDEIISPIIEPVKETTVTLKKTLECMIENEMNFNLIINPQVGDIKSPDDILEIIEEVINDYENYQPTFIINGKSNYDYILNIIAENEFENISIICYEIPNNENDFFDFIKKIDIKYIIISEEINSKRFLREIKKLDVDKITLSDQFNVQRKNADYQENDDEFFSDEHLFYEEEGFVGFSDYLTIGKEYTDAGFLPYAVVIHLTYVNSKEEIWVRHFVSDSNDDTTDVAGKFSEALEKLIEFIEEEDIHTIACEEFRELHDQESYSGLGSLKKLSIMHHIELMYDFLN